MTFKFVQYKQKEDYFNSHAHVERDLVLAVNLFVIGNFNSHAHVERDDYLMIDNHCQKSFQLTRSRGA